MLKSMTVRATLVALACAISFSAHALADAPKRISIPAGDLRQGLLQLSKEYGVELVYQPEAVSPYRTQGVRGTYEAKDAVRLLLKGTPLELRTDPSGAMLIAPPKANTTSTDPQQTEGDKAAQEGKRDSSGAFLLAQAAPQQGTGASSVEAQHEETAVEKEEKKKHEQLQEVVVTGTHIRGEEPIGSDLIVIDRQAIDESGYGRLDDVMATLPQNFSGISETFSEPFVSNLTYGSEVQLRGLGPGTTLALVNGLRQPSGGTQGAFVDVSSIPVSAIERIEVLPDGASALYGSDAIGGVVNVVLRRDYTGADTRVRTGFDSEGGGRETEVSQLLGTHWSSGHAMVGYEYSRRDPILDRDRAYTSTSGDEVPFGGSDWRLFYGNPGNILSATGHPAYAIPTGQNGTHLTSSQLLPGVVNYFNNNYADLIPLQETNAIFASASQDIASNVELFADARYGSRHMNSVNPQGIGTFRVPATNPFYVNPFGGLGAVRVAYDFSSLLGPSTDVGDVDTVTADAGAKIRLAETWNLTVSASYGREVDTWNLLNRLNRAAINAALADSDPTTALNIFGDGSAENQTTLSSIRENAYEQGVSTIYSAGAIVDGNLLELPAGESKVAFGLDYRHEALHSVGINFDDFDTESGRTTSAAFAELTVPIVGERQAIPALQALELSVAGRYDDYSDFGSTFNPKLGLEWRIFSGIKARGTWGKSFRAPPFYLENPAIQAPFSYSTVVPDPRSPTGTSNVIVLAGTLPNLQPETAKTWTAGLDLQPMSQLKISATYFDIDYRNRIQTPSAGSSILTVENEYANTGVITRNPTAAQIASLCADPNFTGDCTGPFAAILDLRQRNLAVARVSGLDAQVQGRLDISSGVFSATLSGTYMFKDEQQVTPLSPAFSVLDTVNNPLALRLRGGVSWSLEGWSASATVNHTGRYKDPSFIPAATVDAWTTVDAGVRYSFSKASWLSGASVSCNAVNLFDRLPPFVNESQGYDPANATLIGRAFSVQLGKAW